MLLHTQTGQNQTDERQLRELLRKADEECAQRVRAAGGSAEVPKTTGKVKAHYNDAMQTSIQNRVNETFDRLRKPTTPGASRPSTTGSGTATGKARRIQDIDDETLVRSITDPMMMNLDERADYRESGRSLNSLTDDEFIRALTDPATMDLR